MSASAEPNPAEDRPAPQATGDAEADAAVAVDVLPVLAPQPRAVQARLASGVLAGDGRPAATMMPAVQAAAVAAGGFVAGAAVVGLVTRRHRNSSAPAKGRRAARSAGRSRGARAGELVQIVGSRSLLVDVHLLGGPRGRG